MKELIKRDKKEIFFNRLTENLSKSPFGSLPKTELEYIILDAIISSNEGYENVQNNFLQMQKSLKISKTKLLNKVMEAEIRYGDNKTDAKKFFIEVLKRKNPNKFIVERQYLILQIFDPLLLDNVKSFLQVNNIINDTSFNQHLVKIEPKGLLKILPVLIEPKSVKKIEDAINKQLAEKDRNAKKISITNQFDLGGLINVKVDLLNSMGCLLNYITSVIS